MKTPRRLRNWILLADLGWIVVAVLVAWFFRYGSAWNTQPRSSVQVFGLILLASSLTWTILGSWLDLDGFRGGWRLPAMISQLLLAVTLVMATLLTAGYLSRMYVSRLALLYFGMLMLGGFMLTRIAARSLLHTRYRAGTVRRVVIVGSGPVAREAAAKIERHPEMLCQVVGFLARGESSLELLRSETPSNVVNIQTCGIVGLLQQRQVDELIFAVSRNTTPEVAELMDQCAKRGIAVSVIPQPYELYMSAPELVDLEGLPILRLRPAWASPDPAGKRALDLGVAALLLIPCLALILVAAGVLKLKKGKGFAREERCGLHGKTFWMYRLNSPRRDANLASYERIMGYLSLTELPQLFNVFRGEMSLVGPRPEGVDALCHYTDWHFQRLNVRPGLTGLAQVCGLRDENPLEDKIRYDLQYILHRSLFQDVSLLLQTIWTLAGRLGSVHKHSSNPSETQHEQTISRSLAIQPILKD